MQKNIITLIIAGIMVVALFGGVSYINKQGSSDSNNSYEGYYTKSNVQEEANAKSNQESKESKNITKENNNSQGNTDNNSSQNNKNDNQIILYYGKECPHCHDVLKYLNENSIKNKVNYSIKEVWHDKQNQQEMMRRVQQCQLNPEKVGVPFLYAEGKCYLGTPDVISFFKKKANAK